MHAYLIAGEQSGDLLGARLMQALREKTDMRFDGIGGMQMQEQGLQSLFPMQELSLMGFVEILPHIPRLQKRICQTVKDIQEQQPDVVITIDSPGFCFRVVKALRQHWPKDSDASPRFVHYVAPSVWAYKPERAKKLAALYDSVLTLLPFEPAYFTAEGMEAVCVGHPLVENPPQGDGASFRTRHGIAAEAKLITALPGSRMGEIHRHLPILRDTLARIAQQNPAIVTVIPAVPHVMEAIRQRGTNWPTPLVIVDQSQEKWDAFAASDVALAKSGTVTLELALSDTPMAVFYKVNPLSAWLMRRMIRCDYVTLVNILENRRIIPELLQEDATPEKLAQSVLELLQHGAAEQHAAFRNALQQLGMGAAQSPSQKAAAAILTLCGKAHPL